MDPNLLLLLALNLLLLLQFVLFHQFFVCYECYFEILLAALLAVCWYAKLHSSSLTIIALRSVLLGLHLHPLSFLAVVHSLPGTWFLEDHHFGHFVGAFDALVVASNNMLGLHIVVIVVTFVAHFIHHFLILLMPSLLNSP